MNSPAEIAKLLATGAERFETAARNHLQAKCVPTGAHVLCRFITGT